MPFIDSRITVKLPKEKEEAIKARLGKDISLLGKSEDYLMVGFQDEYTLYMGGEKLERGAYVAVRLLGDSPSKDYERMTGAICKAFEEELGIPAKNVYVTYLGLKDWGWNGSNF